MVHYIGGSNVQPAYLHEHLRLGNGVEIGISSVGLPQEDRLRVDADAE
jgi:hypothetical protein